VIPTRRCLPLTVIKIFSRISVKTRYIFVPGGCTGLVQVMDTHANEGFKKRVRLPTSSVEPSKSIIRVSGQSPKEST